MGDEEISLETLAAAAAAADKSQEYLRSIVAQLRAQGEPWKAIGDTLGVSRQAAQQRFKDVQ